MTEYIEWGDRKYQEIPDQDLAQEGEAFICRTQDFENPFDDWNYIVGLMGEEKAEALGKFKNIEMARVFAMGL